MLVNLIEVNLFTKVIIATLCYELIIDVMLLLILEQIV